MAALTENPLVIDQAPSFSKSDCQPSNLSLLEPNSHSTKDLILQILLATPRGRTAVLSLPAQSLYPNNDNNVTVDPKECYDSLMQQLLTAARNRDLDDLPDSSVVRDVNNKPVSQMVLVHNGTILDKRNFPPPSLTEEIRRHLLTPKGTTITISLAIKILGRGGMDRQNRVGSKFGGGGVSSAQQSERERKERLKQLALESIDLAKDPYLMRNHLGTYECKLCLTLHTNEANYLSHTQGKKHQQGLARRAHMEKLKQEKEQQQQSGSGSFHMQQQQQAQQPKAKKIRIGRPAYQVFKSRDSDTNQRCLSFELHYPEIEVDLQPRHRFMSAFEQRVETPPDRRFQYLLFAAEPYETVAFKIPNEPIDKGQDRFVTHWDADDKKFTLTLYFLEQEQHQQENGSGATSANGAATTSSSMGVVTVS